MLRPRVKARPRLPAGRRGFTLAEFLLTIILFTGAFFPLLSAVGSIMAASGDVQSNTTALGLARGKMEEIKNLSYTGIASAAKSAVPGFPGYSQAVSVTESPTNLKDILVTVYWTTKIAEKNVTLETYVVNVK